MKHWVVSIAIAAAAITAAAAVASTSVPAMPPPDGKYSVGVVRAEFVDPSRRLDIDAAASGPRRLPAIVWYPAERHAGDAVYMEGHAATVTVPAIARNFGYAVDDLRALTALHMNVSSRAAPAQHARGFPVVVFSHGLFLYPEQNSALASRLASHGYIVVSIAHPGDAADVRLEDGRTVATKLAVPGDDPRFSAALKTLAGGTDLASRREALTGYAEAFAATRLGRSFVEWRDDTLVVAQSIVDGNGPRALRDVLKTADRSRLAFVGMSFGGATSATSCKLVNACRAAVNLDGQNFDPDLFDRSVERPLLLMLSDWTRYSVFEGQSREADFTPNDLAYESWNQVGESRDVVRVRLEGIRHMGFTELVSLLEGPKRDERVGEIGGDEASSATGDLVLAFLNAHVHGGGVAAIDRAIERHPRLKRHAPTRMKKWFREQNPATANYERRVFDIPMRDGVKLHTVIVIPKGTKNAPILLTRTPYDAEGMTRQTESDDMRVLLDGFDNVADVIVEGGYIRVVQDIRGKHGSGGDFVVTRPLAGSPFNRTSVDEATDAYDTIDWLVKHVAEANGNVGIIGTSYNGFTALMALVNPHPALKVAVPMDPMVDGWRGDDWFHNGAFRQYAIASIHGSESRDNSTEFPRETADLYDVFMRAGSVGALASRHGTDKVPFWRNIVEHPAYDEFWESQALDKILASRPLQVPVMIVGSLWDQEDIYGATAIYKAIEPRDDTGKRVYLTLGPWHHAQSIGDGSSVGKIRWGHDTAKWWRQHVLAPFLAHHLQGVSMDVAPVTAFQSGSNEWRRLDRWPPAPANAKLYLKPDGELGFDAPSGPMQTADYISDPADPVTFVPRPMRVDDNGEQWESWLTSDQRSSAGRRDVLTFTSKVLDQSMSVAGEPVVKLMASTSGTDSDWVVKLIDVYPDQGAEDPAMSGYQLPVAMEIFRGRYRQSLSRAVPIESNEPLRYEFALPDAHHVFRPGHRIMVQVQSSWFPLYDRNPQTFVANMFFAKPADYVKATQKIVVAGPDASYIELPGATESRPVSAAAYSP